MPLHTSAPADRCGDEVSIRPEFAQPGELRSVRRFRLGKQMLPAQTAYQLVHDELLLDASSRLNLATFVGTWMEPDARILIDDCRDKNIVDRDSSPQTTELEMRCVSILADLWNSEAGQATGCSTTGSSEVCMLGGLALKWRWRERRRAAGPFRLLSDGSTIPVFAFRLADQVTGYTAFDVSEALRLRGWRVPAYTLPANLQDTAVLRIVVRNGFGQDLAELLARDLRSATTQLGELGGLPPHEQRPAFHH